MEMGAAPKSKVLCLSERGLKTRVVTVGESHHQVNGHLVRKRLFSGLRHTPGARYPLEGASDEKIIQELVGAIGQTLVSTDLTRATDLLPFDLILSVISGIWKSGRITLEELQCLHLLHGPQKLSYNIEGE